MIKVNDLKKTYGKGTRHKEEVLHGVNFELPETGFVCILGRSGSGKTSLLNAIGGLDVYDSGSVEIAGKTVSHSNMAEMDRKRNEYFGYVFQNYYLLPEHSSAYNVYLGLNSLALSEKEKLERVGDALKKVGMLRFAKRLVGELSGGQQQRIAIARALAKSPKVIFADEPTGNLDEESTLNICTLLKKLSKKSLVVMVTHEERLANFFADRIITIAEGNISGDVTEWERNEISSVDSSTVYAGDFEEQNIKSDSLNVRVLTAPGSDPAKITLIIENGRLIVKSDDSRIVMCSKNSLPPYVEEGRRPKLDPDAIVSDTSDEAQEETPKRSGLRSGLGLKMLINEMRTTASKKKLRNAAAALFLVLMSVMVLLTISDIAEVLKIKPEDFITSDSHTLEVKISKGQEYNDRSALSVTEYIPEYLEYVESYGYDFDYIPDTNKRLTFSSPELPQYANLSMSLGKYDLVNVSRLDPATLVYGRMPERSDEIVVDIWVIRKCTDEEGLVQNLIPDNEYMIGKRLDAGRNNYAPVIVGICNSGQPSVYMTTGGLLSIGIHGLESIPYSEFVKATGMTDLPYIESGDVVVIGPNDWGQYYVNRVGSNLDLATGLKFHIREVIEEIDPNLGIGVALIISDDDVEPFLKFAVETVSHFDLWCADRALVKSVIEGPVPKSLDGVITVEVKDTYYSEYSNFMAKRIRKTQTRTIIMGAAVLLCLVMLYVIQRFRVRDRLGMIGVYRLLGIPGRDSLAIFILESVVLTFKYVVPTVFLVWAAAAILPLTGIASFPISIPLWAPFAAIGVILVIELIVAVIAVARLLVMPPAKLAAKYDF
jgi:ABC-type lipoprotein export system ATPase subunit